MGDLSDIMSVRIDTTATQKALDQLQRDLNRATMQGLRAAGRSAKQVGRRNAPVGSGRLKAGIHSSRRLRNLGPNNYELSVGPWGPVVNFYRARVDEGAYMRTAYDDAIGRMESRFVASYTRCLERAGRL